MSKLDESGALAIVFANTRRSRRTVDLVTIAEACKTLVELYGSQKKVAERVDLHPEMIREFRQILKLIPRVRKMVERREIDRLDVAYQLAKIDHPKRQLQAAKEMRGLGTKDSRTLQGLITGGKLTPAKAKKLLLESKLRGLHLLVLDFEDDEFEQIAARARDLATAPAQLAKDVVLRWVKRKKRTGARWSKKG